jgi:branched-subunit amino acid transport protein
MQALVVAALAAGTYAFRFTGPAFRSRVQVPERLSRMLSAAAAVLLISLAATAALTQGHGSAGWARPAGVAVAGLLVVRRAPLPVVVVAAAVSTALLRLAGVS